MTEVLGRGARVAVAGGTSLVLPVDIHEEEEAEGDDREERLQEVARDGDQAFAERVESRHR